MSLKIDRLETHDRWQLLQKQGKDISECCQDLLNQRPFGDHPFYIFAHARTIGMDERFKLFNSGVYRRFEEVPEKTIIWQPRLTKPKAETNSMLFKGFPGTDLVKVIWMIPDRALWDQYKKGNITESNIVRESINNFQNNKELLERGEPEDLTDEQIYRIYQEIAVSGQKTVQA